MPIQRISARDAHRALSQNLYATWPRREDSDNRFDHYADPAFKPGFQMEPGQRVFTIGSCFARHIEQALASRGFEIPTLDIVDAAGKAAGDQLEVLNNYVPGAIAPQIRWAFGLEQFDIAKHGMQVRAGRYIDLQLPTGIRAMPSDAVIGRRERIGAIYRKLAESDVVLITLGLIEAWFDHNSGLYINATPLRSMVEAEPNRFELHVLEYNEVLTELRALVALLDQVCPRGYRMILTVSPVPLAATFTTSDVAVANAYSKAVLRAAVEVLVVERPHVEYFPSYESVTLTDRSLAFADDQMHVNRAIVNFNVDRMISRYVRESGGEATSAEIIEQARKEGRTGNFGAALKRLQAAWAKQPDDAELVFALAQAQLNVGAGPNAEKLLVNYLATHSDAAAHLMLAEYYNACGRHAEAAVHAETVAGLGKLRLRAAMQRISAYYHLQRYDEGIAVLNGLRQTHAAGVSMVYWKARYLEKLDRPAEAEEFFRRCNTIAEQVPFMLGFAEFLMGQKRWAEAVEWVDHALLTAPNNKDALKLRNDIAGHLGPGQKLPPAPASERSPMKLWRRLVRSW